MLCIFPMMLILGKSYHFSILKELQEIDLFSLLPLYRLQNSPIPRVWSLFLYYFLWKCARILWTPSYFQSFCGIFQRSLHLSFLSLLPDFLYKIVPPHNHFVVTYSQMTPVWAPVYALVIVHSLLQILMLKSIFYLYFVLFFFVFYFLLIEWNHLVMYDNKVIHDWVSVI